MNYHQGRRPNKPERGDEVKAVELPGRRVTVSRAASVRLFGRKSDGQGFTLIELVITITVLTILTLGIVPLLKLSVKRQKEQQLRDELRQMRTAIDEFHRDTVGMTCTGVGAGISGGLPTGEEGRPVVTSYIDPRSKVVISDCTLFGVDNPDRYPADLETLVNGVNVIPRAGTGGGRGNLGVDATKVGGELATKKKVYLRSIPIDPITGKAEWDLRSCYDSADTNSWGGENVFEVRSKSKETALNGEKYSDW
ncbi:MAG: type II secretion system GspH family protein [Acidobacteriota bacterium]|nr:type II secretion system GspH family protein [Acidobacteriota bacterium]